MNDKKISLGEEVLQWAEKNWALDKLIKGEMPEGSESVSYDHLRRVLVNVINRTAEERIIQHMKLQACLPDQVLVHWVRMLVCSP